MLLRSAQAADLSVPGPRSQRARPCRVDAESSQRCIIAASPGPDQEYHALQGTSPLDGCILNWDPVSLRVVSPCSFMVYDLHGNVVRGLTTVPLLRYAVFVREGIVFVTES